MPFTFLAHPAPLLPLARRWPGRVDGLALVVGSMSPDFAYVLTGTRFELWAHAFPGLVTFCLPATLAVAWLVARGLARVVAGHLPELGGFHLGDYRALAAHRFHPLRFVLWAFVGALSHVALDSLGHSWGWPAQHWRAYRADVFPGTFLGKPWTVFRVVQYAGHLGLSPLCLWLLHRYGTQRWLAAAAATVPEFRSSARTHAVLWSAAAVGALGAGAWVLADREESALILRLAAGVFAGLLLGAALARGLERTG